MPYLVQKRIDGTKIQEWELGPELITLGRGAEAQVRIKDDRISRQHCTLLLKDGGYLLQDLGSTNGTWVNGERITEAQLKPNDKVRLGQTVISFVTEKPKGINTVMGEIEAEGKGLKTYIRELNQPPSAPPPPSQ